MLLVGAIVAIATVDFGGFCSGGLLVHFVAELLVNLFEKIFVRYGFKVGAAVLVGIARFEYYHALFVKSVDFFGGQKEYVPFIVELSSSDMNKLVAFARIVEKFDYFFVFATAVAVVFVIVFATTAIAVVFV